MDASIISQAIQDQQEEVKAWLLRSKTIEREANKQFQSFLPNSWIKVISGVRRCGKSFLSIQALGTDSWIYLNFDDERFINLQTSDLNQVYQAALQIRGPVKYWVLDEIQNIEHWDLFVNRLQRKGLNVIVTGSNGKILSREISTHLTGRSVTLELFPFSFAEYLKYFKIDYSTPSTAGWTSEQVSLFMKYFELWMNEGAFPETLENSNKRAYLQELYDRVITRDVLQRYNLRNPKGIKQLAAVLVNSLGQEVSYKKLTNLLSLGSMNTVKKYVGYLTDCYLFFELEAYSDKSRERQARPRKIYCIDNGLYNSLKTLSTDNKGRMLENIVFLALRRSGENISYLRDPHFEVDFVISKEGKNSKLIQVCLSLQDPTTKKREINSLVSAGKKLKLKAGTILTLDEEWHFSQDGFEISCLPVWKWLLKFC